MKIDRRKVLGLGAGAIATSGFVNPLLADATPGNTGPVLGDDGLYHQSWFLDSFLDLKDDITEAAANNKRLVVFWELKGCPYCKETHFTNLARDDIRKFIQANFDVLQLNIIGSREVVDIDGKTMTEKQLANKYGVRFTPTFQFFDSDVAAMVAKKPRKREVARAPGYLKPNDFLLMFQYVQSNAYKNGSFRKFLKSRKSS